MDLRTPADFGMLIRAERKKAGLDQATLARRAGVSRWWITEMERGKRGAELGLVLRTLATLGIDLNAGMQDPEASRPSIRRASDSPHSDTGTLPPALERSSTR